MLTLVLLPLAAIALLAAVYLLRLARQWRRISERAGDEMWGAFERQIALSGAGSDVRLAWLAIGCGWVALVVMAVARW